MTGRKEYTYCCISTFIWGMVAHAYVFFNNCLSHDWLNAFYATETEELWKVELGRFMVPIYRYIIRDSIALPWLIGLIAMFFLSMAIYIIIRLFDVKSKVVIALVSGIMVTNITVTAQCATYLYELDFNMLSLVLALLGVYIWHNYDKTLGYLLCILCFVASMGIYQSYISAAVILMLFLLIMMLIKEIHIKQVVKKGIYGVTTLGISCICYYVTSKLACQICGVELQSRTDVLNLDNTSIVTELIKLFVGTYKHFIEYIQHDVYDHWFVIAIILYILVTSIYISFMIIKGLAYKHIAYIPMYIILVLLMPFGADAIFFLVQGGTVHDLMTYSIWLLATFFVIGVYKIAKCEKYKIKGIKIIKVLGIVLLCMFLWQNIIISNTAYLKKNMEYEATLSVMTRVVEEMEETDGYIYGETPVAFIGKIDCIEQVDGFEKISAITGLRAKDAISQDTSTYFYNAYKAYFDYVLQYKLNFCRDYEHEQLKTFEIVKSMPTFPSEGSIGFVDNILVVKMGN